MSAGSPESSRRGPNRRGVVQGLAGASLLGAAAGAAASLDLLAADMPAPIEIEPGALAADEAHWARIGRYFARTEGIVNLEHGYWGRMANPVLQRYQAALARVNQDNSFYARRLYGPDYQYARERVARLLGADVEEVALTRNATEAVHNLIRQYRGLGPGDAVLLADVDYPAFKRTMSWLEQGRGVRVITLDLPPRPDAATIEGLYADAFEQNPELKLALVTHASNQHGLVLPIAAIAAHAERRGVHLICDAAQSLGLLDFRIDDLGVDWAAFNLHKWIGAPLGLGALYMRKGSLAPIAPYPGERDPVTPDAITSDAVTPDVQKRVHTGTWDFAAAITIPAALDFHEAVGGAAKEARLRHLRARWTSALDGLDGLEILGAREEADWSGMGAFRLAGRATPEDSQALQRRLQNEFGIFTVSRYGLASGACVRVTPQVYTSVDEVDALVAALRTIVASPS
ncbi:MAG: aminotransferase class V-fold PLP-dependent enzyme [Pseudomonadales bacterium]|nr:aminotransferase class V-fold PLP-dependent enzyme [Pseudomonadales bacterium]